MSRMTEKKKLLIFINILIAGISTSMLSTAMSTALPAIINYYHISLTTGQWVTSGYSLAMAIVMPLTAFLVKKIPTKKLYISGILCFMIGELLSIISPVFSIMMVGRIFQAVGNGVLVSMGQVVILTMYDTEKKGTMMGWYGLATAGAPIIAPTIGGILVETVGWKYIFVFTFIIMAVALLASIVNFEDILTLQDVKFDLSSFILSMFAFGGITLGVGNLSSNGLLSFATALPLCIGLITGIFFVIRQLHLEKAFLDVRILKNKNYTLAVISSVLLYLVMMGGSVLMPLYVQSVLGKSAIISAFVTMPGSIATAVANPFAGKIYDKLGIKKLMIFGSICLLISNISMYFITASMPLFIAALFNVFRNVSIGCLMMPLLTWGTSQVNLAKVSDASSLLTSLRTVAGSIGAAVFVGIMSAVTTSSAASYGKNAALHGLNVAFLSMSIATLVLVLISVFCIKEKKRK